MSRDAFEPIKAGLQEILEKVRSGEFSKEKTSNGVMRRILRDEMLQGFLDGYDDDRDEYPSESNRSAAYKHGWLNGRDDRLQAPRDVASNLRAIAEKILTGAA